MQSVIMQWSWNGQSYYLSWEEGIEVFQSTTVSEVKAVARGGSLGFEEPPPPPQSEKGPPKGPLECTKRST